VGARDAKERQGSRASSSDVHDDGRDGDADDGDPHGVYVSLRRACEALRAKIGILSDVDDEEGHGIQSEDDDVDTDKPFEDDKKRPLYYNMDDFDSNYYMLSNTAGDTVDKQLLQQDYGEADSHGIVEGIDASL